MPPSATKVPEPFCQTLIEQYQWRIDPTGQVWGQVEVPPNGIPITTLEQIQQVRQRHQALPPERQRPLIWVGGGGALVLQNRYVVALQRSLSAYSSPGKVTLPTGRADHPAEWHQPKVLIRELFEEILICQRDQLVIPHIPGSEAALSAAQELGLEYSQIKTVSWEPIPFRDCVLVSGQEVFGFWHLDPRLGEVNLIHVFGWSGDAELTFYDGEWGWQNGSYGPLRRTILLIDLWDLSQSCLPDGTPCPLIWADLTTHCAALIQRLRQRAGLYDNC